MNTNLNELQKEITRLQEENKSLQKQLNDYENYDYLEVTKNDVFEYFSDYFTVEELENYIGNEYELAEILSNDNLTGNIDGSYTINTWRAETYLTHEGYLLHDALEDFGMKLSESAEHNDVIIREYILFTNITDFLKEYLAIDN